MSLDPGGSRGNRSSSGASTRQSFAHQAVLAMSPDADMRAIGAKITHELCGSWTHEPPCPLAPHHTRAERSDGEVHARILFATEPELEGEVRRRIDSALASGRLDHPEAGVTLWTLLCSGADSVSPEEETHAERLVVS
jgi:hypothetical protein